MKSPKSIRLVRGVKGSTSSQRFPADEMKALAQSNWSKLDSEGQDCWLNRLVLPLESWLKLWQVKSTLWRQNFPGGAKDHIYIVCYQGFSDGVWHDGPIAHVLPGGDIGTYIPSGSVAQLELELGANSAGKSLEEAYATEGSLGAIQMRSLSCAFAQLRNTKDPNKGTSSSAQEQIHLTGFLPNIRWAVLLTLLRMAHISNTKITLDPTSKDLSPPYHRLLQHLDITISNHSAIPISAQSYLALIPTGSRLEELCKALNAQSEVIPRGVLSVAK